MKFTTYFYALLIYDWFTKSFHRVELGLQHNETIDIFTDDYFVLTDKDSTFGSKSDNHLKVDRLFLVMLITVILSVIELHFIEEGPSKWPGKN